MRRVSLLHTPITFRGRRVPQPRLGLADVPVLARATACPTTGTSCTSARARSGGAGAGDHRGHRRVARGPHLPGRLGHLVGRARRGARRASPPSSSEHGARRRASSSRTPAARPRTIARGRRPAARPRRGGWQPVAPSARRRSTTAGTCRARSTRDEIADVVEAFAAAARARSPPASTARAARRARLPDARVPLAAVQPRDDAYGGDFDRPHRACCSRSPTRCARSWPARAAALGAHLGDRLGRRRLDARRHRSRSRRCSARSASTWSTARPAASSPRSRSRGPGLPGAVRRARCAARPASRPARSA